jgi:2'-5' RNA ligase
MRAFLGLALADDVRRAVVALQEALRRDTTGIAWVLPESLHVTLKFLGDISDAQREHVQRAIDLVARSTAPFTARLGPLGGFPSLESPRVLWVGLSEGHEQVAAIARQLEERMVETGIPREERAFTSHITIARLRSPQAARALNECLGSVDRQPEGSWRVEAITLYQSQLGREGARYAPLAQAPLGG